MEWFSILLGSSLSLVIAILLSTESMKMLSNDSVKPPPGPKGWPVIGNILDVGAAPYSSLAKLIQTHGPVMWIRLGSVNTLVISSSEAAAELFRNQDPSFLGRNTKVALRVHDFHHTSMVMSQYGPYWRLIRGIYDTQLMTDTQINQSQNLRAKCMDMVMRWIAEEAQAKESIEIAPFISLLSMNMIGNVALSKERMVDPKTEEGSEFFTAFKQGIELITATNFADLFPILQGIDLQHIESNTTKTMRRVLDFVLHFVNERISDRQKGLRNIEKDFLDVLLEYEGNDQEDTKIPTANFVVLVTELLMGSTDSSTTIIEWALAELLKNPTIMKTLQAELDDVVGAGNKVEEDHIEKLKFLQAVIKETLRLHAPVPLLIPRRAMEDTNFMGYSIPKDTQILVNVWAITRDPVTWEDPLVFKPERFLSSSIDYRGENFEFLPFGGGRRMCGGVKLADRILHLGLASFVHSFQWFLPNGTTPENMDMGERMAFTLEKGDPLRVLLKPRIILE